MSLFIARTGLEVIWLWLNQILTIIIELSIDTNLLYMIRVLPNVAVTSKGLERLSQFVSLQPIFERVD